MNNEKNLAHLIYYEEKRKIVRMRLYVNCCDCVASMQKPSECVCVQEEKNCLTKIYGINVQRCDLFFSFLR